DRLLLRVRMAVPEEGEALWHRRQQPALVGERDLAGEERGVLRGMPEQREDAAEVAAGSDHRDLDLVAGLVPGDHHVAQVVRGLRRRPRAAEERKVDRLGEQEVARWIRVRAGGGGQECRGERDDGGEAKKPHVPCITESTSSRFRSISSGVRASRFNRSSGSVFDGRTFMCQSPASTETPSRWLTVPSGPKRSFSS